MPCEHDLPMQKKKNCSPSAGTASTCEAVAGPVSLLRTLREDARVMALLHHDEGEQRVVALVQVAAGR